MNYESISDWFDLVAPSLCWEMLMSLDIKSTSTAGDLVLALADIGVDAIKTANPITKISEAESLSYIWWSSQCLKKFKYGVVASKDETYKAFVSQNASVTKTIPARHYSRIRELLERALPNVDDDDIVGNFGPGAVAERLSTLQKWNSIPNWSFDPLSVSLCEKRGQGESLPPCRLHCVPKNFDKFRLITVEPVENSFGQQWARTVLMKSIYTGPLRGSALDFVSSDDPGKIQRRRALQASQTARCATLDLSCASDSISFEQVAQVFPSRIVAYLERFRTPMYTYTGLESPLELQIYGGMGNATTFLVESLYFWAVTTSICEWLGDRTPVSVYGDDIVCGNRAANHPLFEPELAKFGLKLNVDKSGMSVVPGFRESCGIVCHSGFTLDQLIRIPGCCNSDIPGLIGLVDLVNRLAVSPRWYHTVLADDIIRKSGIDGYVPNVRSMAFGSAACALHVPWLPDSYNSACLRYNRDLHVTELKTHVIQAKQRRVRRVHLTQAEAWGVITRQMRTSTGKSNKTDLTYPSKDVYAKKRWARAISL